MNIYDFTDYKEFALKELSKRKTRGHFKRIAQHIGVHSSLISQVFKGDKDLSLEQAHGLCTYLGLNPKETQYFLLMVQLARAGTSDLKDIFTEQINELRKLTTDVQKRSPDSVPLPAEYEPQFFSYWYYTAIKLLTSIPNYQTPEEIAEKTNLPLVKVREVLDFLVLSGMCVHKEGLYKPGVSVSHLAKDSHLNARHHNNWRLKAMEKHGFLSSEELAITAPITLSAKDQLKVRQVLLDAVEKINGIFSPSPAEELHCLNIDWFKV